MASLKKCGFVLITLAGLIAICAVILQLRGGSSMTCIFCDIVSKKTEAEILYEDEQFVAFKDIKPESQFHFLIIPKTHIPNTKALTLNDKQMVLDMKRIMLELLANNNQNNLDEISLGFHVPPFNSVKHLHLHGISPISEMSTIKRWVFRPDSFWFKTVDTIINSLPPAASL